jgi:hypothetical protein
MQITQRLAPLLEGSATPDGTDEHNPIGRRHISLASFIAGASEVPAPGSPKFPSKSRRTGLNLSDLVGSTGAGVSAAFSVPASGAPKVSAAAATALAAVLVAVGGQAVLSSKRQLEELIRQKERSDLQEIVSVTLRNELSVTLAEELKKLMPMFAGAVQSQVSEVADPLCAKVDVLAADVMAQKWEARERDDELASRIARLKVAKASSSSAAAYGPVEGGAGPGHRYPGMCPAIGWSAASSTYSDGGRDGVAFVGGFPHDTNREVIAQHCTVSAQAQPGFVKAYCPEKKWSNGRIIFSTGIHLQNFLAYWRSRLDVDRTNTAGTVKCLLW